MKNMFNRIFIPTCVPAILLAALAVFVPGRVGATPYASCITNNNGTIQFYLNESGGSVTVTYEDGTTNSTYTGVSPVVKGLQSFSLGSHTTYAISVSKIGTGIATNINTMPAITPRGIDVNKRAASPYFGWVYAVNAANGGLVNQTIRHLNSDLSGVSTNDGGVTWANSSSSPYRLAVNDDDFLTVGDFSSAHSGVWRIDPSVQTNQLLLGPIGQVAGYAAQSQGDQFSRPLLLGNMAGGANCTLFTVDAGTIPNINASQLNSVLVYSNITAATLPHTNPPDLLGPEVCLNSSVQNNYPGISYYGGYIYCTDRRDGPSGGSANLQVYSITNLIANTAGGPTNASGPGVSLSNPNAHGCVWNSYYNGGVNDYFATATPGSSVTTGPADSQVSPDGKYIATVGYGDNHIEICGLTNGIPDVSTIYNISNTISLTSAGRGICWDAADNVYISSSGGATFQEWSLGFTAIAVTTGNASGTTGFSLVTPSTVVSVVASNSITTTTVSQSNPYGNPTNAIFIISRSGNVSSPLTVAFSLGGTAGSSTYTSSKTGSVTLAAGASSTNITITAVNDGIPRVTTTIVLNLATSGAYTLAPASATLTYFNVATSALSVAAVAPTMYNAFSNDFSSFAITRLGDTNASFTVSSYAYGGTAVAGVDYTLPLSVTFNPGDTVITNFIYPLNNGALPVDSPTNVYVGNKTAIISVVSGSGFTGSGTNTALLTILDKKNPTTTVLFSDPLTDPNDVTNWGVTAANNNMQVDAIDATVVFGFDLQNGDPGDLGAIPLPPSGDATALRLTVNKNGGSVGQTGAAAGVNLYMTNAIFSGNYAARFSMLIVQGLSVTYSTEGPLFGINHTGNDTNWFSASGLLSGWTPTTTNWTSDGVWYWLNADNDYSGGAYLEFTGIGGTNGNTGWTQPTTGIFPPTFANAFKTNVFSGAIHWGPGLVSSASILNGPPYANWADVEIKQINKVVTLSIDKTAIFTYTNTTVWTNGMVMLGYEDPFSSVGSFDGAVYYSGLRVVSLASPSISQIAVNQTLKTAVINFTTVDGDAVQSSFALQSASVVTGPYSDSATATITTMGPGAFQAVIPQSGAIQFYRIRQK